MKKKTVLLILVFFIIFLTTVTLEFFGIIWHTSLFTSRYEIKGIDVSHYQNEITWADVSDDYKFVFIKATEGETYVDNRYRENITGAKNTNLLVGAYHFFTTSVSGDVQAKNFIATVAKEDLDLPPVIDLEVSKDKDPINVKNDLELMIDTLTSHYNMTPILYVTSETYNAFIMGYFEDCDIWIRNIVKPPSLKDKRTWQFWQYSNRGRIDGVNTYVDMNVFYGSEKELLELKTNN